MLNRIISCHTCIMYREGLGKDEEKKLYHLEEEEAAIGGHADASSARYNLASYDYEWSNYKFNRALNHWVIAARLGHDASMLTIERSYTMGNVSKGKEDFNTSTLCAYKAAAAVDAVTSPQREALLKLMRHDCYYNLCNS